jgi:hypothetical protein
LVSSVVVPRRPLPLLLAGAWRFSRLLPASSYDLGEIFLNARRQLYYVSVVFQLEVQALRIIQEWPFGVGLAEVMAVLACPMVTLRVVWPQARVRRQFRLPLLCLLVDIKKFLLALLVDIIFCVYKDKA